MTQSEEKRRGGREEMAGKEAGRHPEERSEKGKRLVGYLEGRLNLKHFQEEGTHKEGRQVQRSGQDWKLSS